MRDALVDWIAASGAEVEVQEASVVERRLPGWVQGARVTNVAARIAGTDPTGTVLLISHHDTVPLSPGAADDASGVAVLLETMRALQTRTPPRNDVVFLFTDGEEIGLYGAEAFHSRHPWARDVKVVVNLEARGSRGPSVLFETGPVDAALIRRVGEAAPRLVGASYAADVYRRLPHDTDFSVFREAGIPGFNFAFIGDVAAYHSALDEPSRLDPASVQHHGASALGLAELFGAMDLEDLPERGSAIFFTLPWLGLVAYPSSWALPLAIGGAVGFLLLLVHALRRRTVRLRPLLGALGLVPLAVAASVLAVHFGSLLWQRALDLRSDMLGPTPWYLLGWALLALAVTWTVLALPPRRTLRLPLAVAGVAWWSLLALGAALALPASSYLLIWPLLFVLPAVASWSWRSSRSDEELEAKQGAGGTVLLALAPVPAILLWVPTLVLLAAALGIDGAAPLALATALVTVLLVPLWPSAGGGRRWIAPAAAAVAAVAVLAAASLSAGYGSDRPRPDSLYYALDTASGEAFWVSEDRTADVWTSRFLEQAQRRALEGFFFRAVDVLAAPAPVLPLQPATVRTVAAPAAGHRLLRVVPPPATAMLRVALSAPGGVELLRLDDQPVEPSRENAEDVLEVSFYAPPAEGLDLLVAAEPGSRLEVETVAHRYTLPTLPDRQVPPRPPQLQPARFSVTDRTLVRGQAVVGEGTVEETTDSSR